MSRKKVSNTQKETNEKYHFRRYQSIARFREKDKKEIGNFEDEGQIIHIFPKIDGTNANFWLQDGEVRVGGRNKTLNRNSHNNGFGIWGLEDDGVKSFLNEFPNLRVYGEWLVKHTVDYDSDAYRKFYAFDVVEEKPLVDGKLTDGFAPIIEQQNCADGVVRNVVVAQKRYLSYEDYKPMLEKHGITVVPLMAKVEVTGVNKVKVLSIVGTTKIEVGTEYEFDKLLIKIADANKYLLSTKDRVGEGLVLKNYNFKNVFGGIIWFKVIHKDFNTKSRDTRPSIIYGIPKPPVKVVSNKGTKSKDDPIEKVMVQKYLQDDLLQKELTKLAILVGVDAANAGDYLPRNSNEAARFLGVSFLEFVGEEILNMIKKHKKPTIDFKKLYYYYKEQVLVSYPDLKEFIQ